MKNILLLTLALNFVGVAIAGTIEHSAIKMCKAINSGLDGKFVEVDCSTNEIENTENAQYTTFKKIGFGFIALTGNSNMALPMMTSFKYDKTNDYCLMEINFFGKKANVPVMEIELNERNKVVAYKVLNYGEKCSKKI